MPSVFYPVPNGRAVWFAGEGDTSTFCKLEVRDLGDAAQVLLWLRDTRLHIYPLYYARAESVGVKLRAEQSTLLCCR